MPGDIFGDWTWLGVFNNLKVAHVQIHRHPDRPLQQCIINCSHGIINIPTLPLGQTASFPAPSCVPFSAAFTATLLLASVDKHLANNFAHDQCMKIATANWNAPDTDKKYKFLSMENYCAIVDDEVALQQSKTFYKMTYFLEKWYKEFLVQLPLVKKLSS